MLVTLGLDFAITKKNHVFQNFRNIVWCAPVVLIDVMRTTSGMRSGSVLNYYILVIMTQCHTILFQ